MRTWFGDLLSKFAKTFDSKSNDPEYEAEIRRIDRQQFEDARNELREKLATSQAIYEISSAENTFEDLDLPAGMTDIFCTYDSIIFGFGAFKIARDLVRISDQNPNFVIVGTSSDGDVICVMRGEEGIFLSVPDLSFIYNSRYATYPSIYHALLTNMYVFE